MSLLTDVWHSAAVFLVLVGQTGREAASLDYSRIVPSPMAIQIVGGSGVIGAIGGTGTPIPAVVKVISQRLESDGNKDNYEFRIVNISDKSLSIPWDPIEAEFQPNSNVAEFGLTGLSISLEASCADNRIMTVNSAHLYGSDSLPRSFLVLKPGSWARLLLRAASIPRDCGQSSLRPRVEFTYHKFSKTAGGWSVSSKPIPLGITLEGLGGR